MNALIILLVAIVVLVCGYVFYGGWLAKQWGIDPNRPTPAHEFEDGKDYVPAAPYVVLGHHFSSIAGAGPINGPIQAAIFGWVPVLLWVLLGGIFFGAMHDFGALFASIRHKGQTLATVIAQNIDDTAKKLFCIFAYLTLIWWWPPSPPLWRAPSPWCRCRWMTPPRLLRPSRPIWPTCARP